MLRLSKKADYALIALTDLASSPHQTFPSAREIAERYDVPVELMAKVLQRLAKLGMVASRHGTRGGYHLSRLASQISVADVIQSIDGPIMVTACSDDDMSCEQYTKCNVRAPLRRLKERIVQSLAAFTISELASDDVPEALPVTVQRR